MDTETLAEKIGSPQSTAFLERFCSICTCLGLLDKSFKDEKGILSAWDSQQVMKKVKFGLIPSGIKTNSTFVTWWARLD